MRARSLCLEKQRPWPLQPRLLRAVAMATPPAPSLPSASCLLFGSAVTMVSEASRDWSDRSRPTPHWLRRPARCVPRVICMPAADWLFVRGWAPHLPLAIPLDKYPPHSDLRDGDWSDPVEPRL
ncbi:hypothetical protein chiPu_0017984 [Chiloscyllium punctatum]|uniref:Uncharacterized protein n=1 Tax=Chiloscyllium punctatum TaxID=137246 RepID=A0A401RKA5_CHIPU|nr:hypothetical protein [Chiloscyllium punctatum]